MPSCAGFLKQKIKTWTTEIKIGGFMDFFGDFELRHKSISFHKMAPCYYHSAIQIENLVSVY